MIKILLAAISVLSQSHKEHPVKDKAMGFAGCLLFLVLVSCAFGRSLTKPRNGLNDCGYESCHKTYDGKLNVHLIPHSHDDVGWLKTVDEYFYGSNSSIQRAGVQFIIGSVLEALEENPDRRFIQVETAFFWQWWKKQSEDVRERFRKLVNTGRLEITNAAWSMNDEAAAHYQSILDQFTWGLRIIDDTLGECGQPNIGWQIDPFGHSNEQASIFARLGYEAVFFARLDYRDMRRRKEDKALELLWQGSKSLGSESNIFTHAFSDFYTQPDTFCWDVLCNDEPMIDDDQSPDYNMERRVQEFTEYAKEQAEYFQTNHILVNMGGDFTYQAALMYYQNIDRLIEGFQRYNPEINVIYSTPSCYLKAVNEASQRDGLTFELKTDDFFPYTSNKHSAWTGFYTSRPNSKRFERSANNVLQAVKQLTAFELGKGKDFREDITLLKEAMGIMQHHDAITGTEKQHVARDYARIVTKAIHTAESEVGEIVSDLLQKNASDTEKILLDVRLCLLANVSHCEASNAENFIVVAYNPLSYTVSDYIRLPTNATTFHITGPSNEEIAYQVTPSITDFSYVPDIQALANDLVFKAENIPPLGLKVYYIQAEATNDGQSRVDPETTEEEESTNIYIGTTEAGFTINSSTGLLTSATLNGVTLNITQQFLFYNGMNGTNEDDDHKASGAYIFRPVQTEATVLAEHTTFEIIKGDIVDEVHQTFNSWIKQIIRIYKNENYIEFDWLVGPLELINDLGVEIISRFTTDLKSASTFYTDSNGRELIKRIRNYRETYEYTDDEPVAGNYYPITARIVIRDEENKLELAVLNDRAQGGSSLKDGAVELMVHRRLLCDDSLGVDEALDEKEFDRGVIARGQHILTFGKIGESGAVQKSLVHQKLLMPTVFVGEVSAPGVTLETLQEHLNFEISGLTRALPENVKILTLEPWKDNTLLLRLEHLYEVDEDDTLSKTAQVNLTDLFSLFDIVDVQELTLGANKLLKDAETKLKWNISGSTENEQKRITRSLYEEDINIVNLNPMEIRTFMITYSEKSEENPGEPTTNPTEPTEPGGGSTNPGGSTTETVTEAGDSGSANKAAVLLILIGVIANMYQL